MNDQVSTNYKIVGDGPRVVVFVHYFGGDSGSWSWLVRKLGPKYRCVLLNLPGFGGTPPLESPSIYAFSLYINNCNNELNLMEYVFCGHSMGAKLALYAAQISTETPPAKLILIAPSPPTTEEMKDNEIQRRLQPLNEEEAVRSIAQAIIKKLGKKRFGYAVASQFRMHDSTSIWWLLSGMTDDIADRIKGLSSPSYLIYSNDDPVIKREKILKEVLPNLVKPSMVALSGIGHLMPMEAPRKLARSIRRIYLKG